MHMQQELERKKGFRIIWVPNTPAAMKMQPFGSWDPYRSRRSICRCGPIINNVQTILENTKASLMVLNSDNQMCAPNIKKNICIAVLNITNSSPIENYIIYTSICPDSRKLLPQIKSFLRHPSSLSCILFFDKFFVLYTYKIDYSITWILRFNDVEWKFR